MTDLMRVSGAVILALAIGAGGAAGQAVATSGAPLEMSITPRVKPLDLIAEAPPVPPAPRFLPRPKPAVSEAEPEIAEPSVAVVPYRPRSNPFRDGPAVAALEPAQTPPGEAPLTAQPDELGPIAAVPDEPPASREQRGWLQSLPFVGERMTRPDEPRENPQLAALTPDFRTALEAYNRGEKARALELWTNAALAGNADAAWLVGNMYVNGDGLEASNLQVGASFYEMAVANGHTEAQVSLATLFRLGRGVPRDMQRAVRLLYDAGAEGHAVAQVDLAEIFMAGEEDVVRRDVNHAMDWYRLAAKQNVALAQVKLAQIHLEGIGRITDEIEGMAWLNAALRIAVHGEEPRWSARVMPLDQVVESDVEGRTLRQIILDLHGSYSAELSGLQLSEADKRVNGLDIRPMD